MREFTDFSNISNDLICKPLSHQSISKMSFLISPLKPLQTVTFCKTTWLEGITSSAQMNGYWGHHLVIDHLWSSDRDLWETPNSDLCQTAKHDIQWNMSDAQGYRHCRCKSCLPRKGHGSCEVYFSDTEVQERFGSHWRSEGINGMPDGVRPITTTLGNVNSTRIMSWLGGRMTFCMVFTPMIRKCLKSY